MRKKRFITAIMAILPILDGYSSILPGLGISDCIIIILAVGRYVFNGKRLKLRFEKSSMILAAGISYILVISVISSILYNNQFVDIFTRTLRFLTYVFAFCLLSDVVKPDFFVKCVSVVCYACLASLIIQYVMYYFAGRYVYFHIYGLKIGFTPYEDSLSVSAYFRPSGFFLEPASMVWYMLPLLIYSLFIDEKRPNYIISIVITVASLMSKSLFGLLFMSFVWSLFILRVLFMNNKVSLMKVFSLLLVSIGIFFAIRSGIISEILVRINFENLKDSASFSGRFLQYDLYNSLCTVQKIFGVGIGNLLGVVKNINNMFAYVLTGSGIVGAGLLLAYFIALYFKSRKTTSKILVACMCIFSFGSNVLLGSNIVYYAINWRVCDEETDNKVSNKAIVEMLREKSNDNYC